MGISVASTKWLFFHCFWIKLEFANVGFCGGRKTGVPGETPSEQGREPTTTTKIGISREVGPCKQKKKPLEGVWIFCGTAYSYIYIYIYLFKGKVFISPYLQGKICNNFS